MNAAGGEEVKPHPIFDRHHDRPGMGWLLHKRLPDDVFLRIELQDVLIAAGDEMQVAAKAVEEVNLGGEFAEPIGEFARWVLQLGEPAYDVEIAKTAGGFFNVWLEVVDGVLEFFLDRKSVV